MSTYFAPVEFERCTPPCTIEQMDAAFLERLDAVREAAGIPLVLNCAYRSREWDLAKGRSGNSAHTRGLAVDIRCLSDATRWRIIRAAIQCGITRIGVGRTFIHMDADPSLPQGVVWHYYDE